MDFNIYIQLRDNYDTALENGDIDSSEYRYLNDTILDLLDEFVFEDEDDGPDGDDGEPIPCEDNKVYAIGGVK